MRKELEQFAKAMELKLCEKDPEYGDSWKTMPVGELLDRLRMEIEEFHFNPEDKSELIDIANVCMMIWYRLENGDKNVMQS